MKKFLALFVMITFLTNNLFLFNLNTSFAASNDEESCIAWWTESLENWIIKCKIEKEYPLIVSSDVTNYTINNLFLHTPGVNINENIINFLDSNINSPNLSHIFKEYKLNIQDRPNWVRFNKEVIPDCSATNSNRANCHGYVEYYRKITVENGPKEYLFNFRWDDLLQLFIDGQDITRFNWDDSGWWNNHYIVPMKLNNWEHTIVFRQTNVANSWKFENSNNVVYIDINWPYNVWSFYNNNWSLKTWADIANFLKTITNYESKKLVNLYDISTNSSSVETCKSPSILTGVPSSMQDKFKLDFSSRKCTYSYEITPTGTISANETRPTKNDVVLTLTTNIDLPTVSGWTRTAAKTYTKTVTQNESGTVNLINGSKTWSVSYNIINIDKIAPTGNITANPTTPTNWNVTLTLKTNEVVETPTWWIKVNDITYTKVISSNENVTVNFTDIAGNTWSASYNITNIDKIAPTGNITANPTIPTNWNVTLTLKTNEAVETPTWWIKVNDTTYTKVISSNGNVTVNFTDKAENTWSASYNVTNIDKTAPAGNISLEPGSYTNGTITLTLTVTKEINDPAWWIKNPTNPLEYTKEFSGNTSGNFTLTDKIGNTSATINYSISKIDKLKPVVTSLNLEWNKNIINTVTAKVNFTWKDADATNSDASSWVARYECKLNNGNFSPCTSPFTFNNLQDWANNLTVKAIDNAWNESSENNTTVTVDRIKPVCGTNWTRNTENPTNQNVTLTLAGSSDADSWLKSTNNYTCEVANNWETCNITIEDNAWNTVICTSPSNLVTNIDKTAPEFDVFEVRAVVSKQPWINEDSLAKNEWYAKVWNIVNLTLKIKNPDTWAKQWTWPTFTWNQWTFKIWNWVEKTTTRAYSFSDSPIRDRNVTYKVSATDKWSFSFTNLVFKDTAWNDITWFTPNYIPDLNVIVDNTSPTVTFENNLTNNSKATQTETVVFDDENLFDATTTNPSVFAYKTISATEACDANITWFTDFTVDSVSKKWVLNFSNISDNWKFICIKAEDLAWNVTYQKNTKEIKLNSNPTDINLSNNSIKENVAVWTEIWTFTSVDADTDDTHTYILLSGNDDFEIVWDKLKVKQNIDYVAPGQKTIRVKTTDNKGWFFEKNFVINIIQLQKNKPNNAPIWQDVDVNVWDEVTAESLLTNSKDLTNVRSYKFKDLDNTSFNAVSNRVKNNEKEVLNKIVVVTYDDGSQDEVAVSITIYPVSEDIEPQISTDILTINIWTNLNAEKAEETLKDKFIERGENPGEDKEIDKPNWITYSWEIKPDVLTPGNQTWKVKVTYSDGSYDVVPVTVKVNEPVIPNNWTNIKPNDDYVTVNFVTRWKWIIASNEVESYFVLKNYNVTLKKPLVTPNTWYHFLGFWEIPSNFTDDVDFSAIYETIDDIVPGTATKPDAYVLVKFMDWLNWVVTWLKNFYVNPTKNVDLTSKKDDLTVKPNFWYLFKNWDLVNLNKQYTDWEEITALYELKDAKVKYEFERKTWVTKTIPAWLVTSLKPADETVKYHSNITSTEPNTKSYVDADQDWVWNFEEYDRKNFIVSNDEEKVVWTWDFVPNNHNVTFEFIADRSLPTEISDLLQNEPTQIKVKWDEVSPVNSTFAPVVITDSVNPEKTWTWTFKWWDQNQKTVWNTDLKFIWTWEFKVKKSIIKYSFVENVDEKTLPAELLAPADEEADYGTTKTPTAPAQNTLVVRDGTWSTTWFTPASWLVNAGEKTFVAEWIFTPKDATIVSEFKSATIRVLPIEVTNLKPQVKNIKYGQNISTDTFAEVEVPTGKWQMTWSEVESWNTVVNQDEEKVIYTWTYTAKKAKVKSEFKSATTRELPTEVTNLKPLDEDSTYESQITKQAFAEVEVPTGKWQMTSSVVESWNTAVNQDEEKVIYTWTYTAKKAKVKYNFISVDSTALDTKILVLNPQKDWKDTTYETEETPENPTSINLEVDNGTWNFVSYDKTSITVNNDEEIFTWKWKFTPAVVTNENEKLANYVTITFASDADKWTLSGTIKYFVNPIKDISLIAPIVTTKTWYIHNSWDKLIANIKFPTDTEIKATYNTVDFKVIDKIVKLSENIPDISEFVTNKNDLPVGTTFTWDNPPVKNPNSIERQTKNIIANYPNGTDKTLSVNIDFTDDISPELKDISDKISYRDENISEILLEPSDNIAVTKVEVNWLPDWLSFDETSNKIIGKVSKTATLQDYTVTVKVKDAANNFSTKTFKITVKEQKENYKPNPKDASENIFVKTDLSKLNPKDFIKNHLTQPTWTKYSWKIGNEPITSILWNNLIAIVILTYPDGSTNEVLVKYNIYDNEAPVITLTKTEDKQKVWEDYNVAKIIEKVEDNYDTISNSQVKITDLPNLKVVWTYVVKYNVSDSSGNNAIEKTFTLTVEENDKTELNKKIEEVKKNLWNDSIVDTEAKRELEKALIVAEQITKNVNATKKEIEDIIKKLKDLLPKLEFARGPWSAESRILKDDRRVLVPELKKYEEVTKEKVEEIKKEVETEKTDVKTVKANGKERIYSVSKRYTSCPMIPNILWDYNKDFEIYYKDIANIRNLDEVQRLTKTDVVNKNWVNNTWLFEPLRWITRAEFLAIVLKVHCYDVSKKPDYLPYYDVDLDTWQARVIRVADQIWIIKWYERDTKGIPFKPNQEISKIEAFGIMMKMAEVNKLQEYTDSYTDKKADWQTKPLSDGEYLWILKPEETEYLFNPNGKLNRDDMVKIIVDIIKLY